MPEFDDYEDYLDHKAALEEFDTERYNKPNGKWAPSDFEHPGPKDAPQ